MLLTPHTPSTTSFSVHSASNPEAALTLLGPSSAMSQMWFQVRRLAPHVRCLLLEGQPDCGQEAIARLSLDLSAQNHRMFVVLSAAEAEARLTRAAGLASIPGDVLLFLPDVEELSLAAQEALLRLIRMRRSRPFTVVAASARDLRSAVGLGQFIPALANLLGGVSLRVPALAERQDDLPMLITHLLTRECRELGCPLPVVTEGFLRAAMRYDWPGNLAELNRVLSALCTLGKGELHAEHLTGVLAKSSSGPADVDAVRLVSLDTVMQEHIGSVLRACRGNKLRAAEVLGISRSTLYRMLEGAATGARLALHPAV